MDEIPDVSKLIKDWNGKGFSLARQRNFSGALECFEQAIRIQPNDVGSWNNKGVVLVDLEKYEEAIACFDRMIEIDPKLTIAIFNKGNAYRNLKQYEKAIACFDHAIARNYCDDQLLEYRWLALNEKAIDQATSNEYETVQSELNLTVVEHMHGESNPRRIQDLTWLLYHWDALAQGTDRAISDKKLSSAFIGSAYTNNSPKLAASQLYSLWKEGKARHTAYIDANGNESDDCVYIVGARGSVLTGNYNFWGVIPAKNTIVISDRFPKGDHCGTIVGYLNLFSTTASK